MSKTAGAGATAAGDTGDVDVESLTGDRIKYMMKDPNFIPRMIRQLDKTMHGLMLERYERKQQIEKDKAAIAEIDHIIKMQVDGNMSKLHSHLDMSRTLKSTATKSIAAETQKLSSVNDEALSLLRKVRNANTKLTSQLASITQQNTKGFSTRVPTGEIIRGETPANPIGIAQKKK